LFFKIQIFTVQTLGFWTSSPGNEGYWPSHVQRLSAR